MQSYCIFATVVLHSESEITKIPFACVCTAEFLVRLAKRSLKLISWGKTEKHQQSKIKMMLEQSELTRSNGLSYRVGLLLVIL